MAAKVKPGRATPRTRESSPISMVTELVKQGTESFFASQRIVFDLVMRQNANTMNAIGERLAALRSMPAALTEVAGEGISNFIAAQRVLLHLAQRENEILMTGVKERAGGMAPVTAMTELVRRSVDSYIDMQQHFLTMAAKETDHWIDANKSGKPFAGVDLAEVAREGIENFVRSQKKFLDVVAEETTNAIEGTKNGKGAEKTELAELTRQGAEAFIDAQKKLLDVAAQQMELNLKAARETVQAVNPFQPVALGDLTRHAVDAFVGAQKSLLDLVTNSGEAGKSEEHEHPRRPKGAARKRAGAVKHEAAAATA
jgi:hypothetical protein